MMCRPDYNQVTKSQKKQQQQQQKANKLLKTNGSQFHTGHSYSSGVYNQMIYRPDNIQDSKYRIKV